MDIAAERAAVIAEAITWIGTPYHHMGRIRGAGADCLTFLAESFAGAGVIPPVDLGYYAQHWHHHRSGEAYLAGIIGYCAENEDAPLPADIVLWRFGRTFSHAAIVVAWPKIIHAYAGRACGYEDAERAAYLTHVGEAVADRGKARPRKVFTLKQWVA